MGAWETFLRGQSPVGAGDKQRPTSVPVAWWGCWTRPGHLCDKHSGTAGVFTLVTLQPASVTSKNLKVPKQRAGCHSNFSHQGVP